ncbi:hypothetical protein [Corynebacterium variabile]|uniref:hypothetical protein n=1 Tax=Corynebacterium variabile TaxID=1727 RepID=UPI003BB04479
MPKATGRGVCLVDGFVGAAQQPCTRRAVGVDQSSREVPGSAVVIRGRGLPDTSRVEITLGDLPLTEEPITL